MRHPGSDPRSNARLVYQSPADHVRALQELAEATGSILRPASLLDAAVSVETPTQDSRVDAPGMAVTPRNGGEVSSPSEGDAEISG